MAAGVFSGTACVCAAGVDLEEDVRGGSLTKSTRHSKSIKKESANAASTRFSWSTERPQILM